MPGDELCTGGLQRNRHAYRSGDAHPQGSTASLDLRQPGLIAPFRMGGQGPSTTFQRWAPTERRQPAWAAAGAP